MVVDVRAADCLWELAKVGVQPRRPIDRPVVPDVFFVVVHNVCIVDVAVGGRVEPPDLIEGLICTGVDVGQSLKVDVIKDMVSQGGGQGVYTTVVHVELVNPHPEHHVIDGGDRPWASNRGVGFDLLDTKDIGRTKVLK
jgi:hypothetical protein